MKLTNNLYIYPESGMLDCNRYLIRDKASILIDSGSAECLTAVLDEIRRDGIDPAEVKVIANSHLHIDHCWANEAFRKVSGARILLHPVQKEHYQDSVVRTASFFGLEAAEFKEDGLFEGDTFKVGDIELKLIPSPGHSPDSVCFYSARDRFLVCGDVIFQQTTGRTDLPGGNPVKLKQSIRNLAGLDIEYLLPGHMDVIQGREKVKRNFDFVIKNVFDWL